MVTPVVSSELSDLTAVTGLTGAELGYVVQSSGGVYASYRSTLKDMAGRWVFNVRNYGAVGDGVTNDQTAISAALAAAIAAKGVLYFPASTSTNGFGYRGSIIVNDVLGLRIVGDGYEASILTHFSSSIDTVAITGTSSGTSGDIIISGLHINGFSGKNAVFIRNVISAKIEYLENFGPTRIEGSVFGIEGCFFYGSPGLCLGIDDAGITTGTGPGLVSNTHMANQSGTATEPALKIIGAVQNVAFVGCQLGASNVNQVCTINGATGIDSYYTCVDFIECHIESAGNAAGTAANFIIGATSKFGHVGFRGGNYFGHGNGLTYLSRDWIVVHRAYNVAVEDVIIANLTATGYTRAGIRLESTFDGKLRAIGYQPRNSIPAYSDASGNGFSVNTGFDTNLGLNGSATYNPANLVDGAGVTTTVTVTGAALGMFAEATFSLDLQGITFTAWVSAADTVSVRFQNETTGAIDLGSGTIRARVRG